MYLEQVVLGVARFGTGEWARVAGAGACRPGALGAVAAHSPSRRRGYGANSTAATRSGSVTSIGQGGSGCHAGSLPSALVISVGNASLRCELASIGRREDQAAAGQHADRGPDQRRVVRDRLPGRDAALPVGRAEGRRVEDDEVEAFLGPARRRGEVGHRIAAQEAHRRRRQVVQREVAAAPVEVAAGDVDVGHRGPAMRQRHREATRVGEEIERPGSAGVRPAPAGGRGDRGTARSRVRRRGGPRTARRTPRRRAPAGGSPRLAAPTPAPRPASPAEPAAVTGEPLDVDGGDAGGAEQIEASAPRPASPRRRASRHPRRRCNTAAGP